MMRQGKDALKNGEGSALNGVMISGKTVNLRIRSILTHGPGEFGAVALNAASGAGVAPWNCFKYQYDLSDIPKLCGVPLISFHYQGTKMLRYGLITPCEGIWLPYIPSDLLNFFTGRYYTELCRTRDILRENLGKTAVKSKFTFARVAPADRKKGVRKKRLVDYLKDVFYILTGRILFHGHTCFAFCRIRNGLSMKLSIITVNRNNKDGLEKTIRSVIRQTSHDYEYIIIDGASTDGSPEIIRTMKRISHTGSRNRIPAFTMR